MRLYPIAFGAIAALSPARADLASNLIAYYDFEASGTAGIVNQVGGGAAHNGSYGSGTTYGVTPAEGTGAGFAGSATFAGAEGASTTNRSDLLVGNALNVAKNDASGTAGSGWFNIPTLDSATLGANFTISAWFFLAPDADNTGTAADVLRDYVFEGATNFDVSFGTGTADGDAYNSWIGENATSSYTGVSNGQWHHVAHVFSQNGSNTELNVFIDGVKVGATLSSPTTNMNLASLNIGAARGGIRVFDGMIDEVGVWTRALKTNEVIELYQRGQNSLALDDNLAAAGKAFVSVEASSPAGGQAFGTGLYNLNEQITVEAVPGLGYLFTGWAAPFNSQPEGFTHTVTASVTITANLVQDSADDDQDGLTNYQELVIYLTVPDDPDTDGDQIKDGEEVQQTSTDPLASQADAVDYILTNLSGPQPGDTVLARNQANNTLTLKLKPATSTTLLSGSWSGLTPASPGASAAANAGEFRLLLPGTSAPKSFFRFDAVSP